MVSSIEAVRQLLKGSYPDSSHLTFIVPTARGRGFLKEFIHREVGGILPALKTFDEYKARMLSKKLGLQRLERHEGLVYLAIYLRSLGAKYKGSAGIAASNLLPAIRCASIFSIDREEMKNLRGIREEHLARIDELFDVMEGFGAFLESLGLFMPELREREFSGCSPDEGEFFVNLPLFTPVSEEFFKRVPQDRKFIDIPAYSEPLLNASPEFASSIHLLKRAGIEPGSISGVHLSFHELQGRASIPKYLRSEIATRLQSTGEGGQLFILLLDESLSFYLWQTVFKPLGGAVNFSLGLPLGISPMGPRLTRFIETVARKGSSLDFADFRAQLARELYRNKETYILEDLYAIEASIDFLRSLERYFEALGDSFGQVAGLLLGQMQFFMEGDRSAPVQLVGLGDATGVPFERGIVIPLNSSAFPSKFYNGPFLNFVHTPQIRKAHLETEELALRQFIAFGKSTAIASVLDESKDMTPSFFFTFLKNEFSGSVVRYAAPNRALRPSYAAPCVELTDEIRNRIATHSFSFSSLSNLLTCPFGFYYSSIERVSAPAAMLDEENVNLVLGTFVHDLFKAVSLEPEPIRAWRPLFEKLWAESVDISGLEGSEIFRLLVLSHLEALSEHEEESERNLLFGPANRVSERCFEATFGNGAGFRLNGRIDCLAESEGFYSIIDFKYKKKPQGTARLLIDSLSNRNSFDPRFQLLIYAYLLAKTEQIPLESLRGYFIYVKEEDPGKRFERIDDRELFQADQTIESLAERIEQIIAAERLEPNYKSRSCSFCLLKGLCKADTFYRKAN